MFIRTYPKTDSPPRPVPVGSPVCMIKSLYNIQNYLLIHSLLYVSNNKEHDKHLPTHLYIVNKAIIVIFYFAQLQKIQASWKKVKTKFITRKQNSVLNKFVEAQLVQLNLYIHIFIERKTKVLVRRFIGKDACCQTWKPKFNSQNLHVRENNSRRLSSDLCKHAVAYTHLYTNNK